MPSCTTKLARSTGMLDCSDPWGSSVAFLFVRWNDIEYKAGPTYFAPDSIPHVLPHLRNNPTGLSAFELRTSHNVKAECRLSVPCTGRAGDVPTPFNSSENHPETNSSSITASVSNQLTRASIALRGAGIPDAPTDASYFVTKCETHTSIHAKWASSPQRTYVDSAHPLSGGTLHPAMPRRRLVWRYNTRPGRLSCPTR
jgi:hypothetical protein